MPERGRVECSAGGDQMQDADELPGVPGASAVESIGELIDDFAVTVDVASLPGYISAVSVPPEPPEPRKRGVVRTGARAGAMGAAGCLTFVLIGVVLLIVVLYACSAAVD